MQAKGIGGKFATQVFEQIRGFGDYGFPESHAASFPHIAYASAWLKRHYPVAFVCALLNAQPMGFYAPATIVDDAKRYGVRVLGVSVQRSDWDCTLERQAGAAPVHALRMGLRYVRLGEADWRRIENARRAGPFRSLADFAVRTALRQDILDRLAEAGALTSGRRQALWQLQGLDGGGNGVLGLEVPTPPVPLAPLSDFESIVWDLPDDRS